MKNIIYIALSFCLLFTSCEDDSEEVIVFEFPYLANLAVGNAIHNESFGINNLAFNLSEVSNQYLTKPSETINETQNYTGSGLNFYYDYKLNYSASYEADALKYIALADGEYETALMTSKDGFASQINISDLEVDSEFISASGTSTREGMQYSKRFEDSFTSTIVLNMDNLVINRITGKIKSGTISFVFDGLSSYGESFSSTGEIRYSDYYYILDFDEE